VSEHIGHGAHVDALGDFLYTQEYFGRFAETSEQLFGADLVADAFSRTVEPLSLGGI
jgi:hypothetical protein